MSFRFLHIADLHLDAPFSGRAELRQRLRAAQRESLSAAVGTLLSLAGNNRLVGVISHVDELKAGIDRRIVVHKTSRGSTVTVEA